MTGLDDGDSPLLEPPGLLSVIIAPSRPENSVLDK